MNKNDIGCLFWIIVIIGAGLTGYFIGGVIIAVIAFAWYYYAKETAENEQIAERDRKREESIEAHRKHMEKVYERGDYNLHCRTCHAPARPIRGTGNRYKCVACGRQFVNAKHPF